MRFRRILMHHQKAKKILKRTHTSTNEVVVSTATRFQQKAVLGERGDTIIVTITNWTVTILLNRVKRGITFWFSGGTMCS